MASDSASPSGPTRYNNERIRIVMVGKTGAGKSATGNTILGGKHFNSRFSSKFVTTRCKKGYGEVDGQAVAVIDTPDLFDTAVVEKTAEDVGQSITYSAPGPHIFLIIIRLGRFTEEEKKSVEMIQKILGQEADKYSMVLFTYGDLLKGKPVEEFLSENKELQELVAKCNGQYHVFNNKEKDGSQVRELINKIKTITEKNGGSHYTTEMFQKAEEEIEKERQRILKEKEEERRKEQEELEKKIEEKYQKEMEAEKKKQEELRAALEKQKEEEIKKLKTEMERQEEMNKRRLREMEAEKKKQEELRAALERELKEEKRKQKEREIRHKASPSGPTRYNNEQIRIVMVGKTGAGKSSTGNTILGGKHFLSRFFSKSVTEVCAKVDGEVDGQEVAVIDTPGLFDTKIEESETLNNIAQSIAYAAPGPHIFLIIIKLGRFTEEEKKSVEKIQKIFGEEANKYSMVLFTHGDQLYGLTMEEFLSDSEDLQVLIAKCNGQYQVFNNKEKDGSQVRELINKIRTIKEKNGGRHYTTEMFQKAEEEIEKEKQRILREKEEEMRKEREELEKKIKEKYEKQIKGTEQRRKAEVEAARQREMKLEREKLRAEHERRAREEAERKRIVWSCCIQ